MPCPSGATPATSAASHQGPGLSRKLGTYGGLGRKPACRQWLEHTWYRQDQLVVLVLIVLPLLHLQPVVAVWVAMLWLACRGQQPLHQQQVRLDLV